MLLPEHQALANLIREAKRRAMRRHKGRRVGSTAIIACLEEAFPTKRDAILPTLSASEMQIIEELAYEEFRTNNLPS